jgi:hypothetical protein
VVKFCGWGVMEGECGDDIGGYGGVVVLVVCVWWVVMNLG